MLVFVGFALNRLKVPFQFLINEALKWEPLLETFGLSGSGLTNDMVSVRLANDSTGPTFVYGHVVRHPRYVDTSNTVWAKNDLQTGGDQAKDQIQYIMLTRAVKDCTLWVHTEPLGWPGERKVLPDDNLEMDDRKENLVQFEQLFDLTANYQHLLLQLRRVEYGFEFTPGDDTVLGINW
jgi:hypothetical protein